MPLADQENIQGGPANGSQIPAYKLNKQYSIRLSTTILPGEILGTDKLAFRLVLFSV